jgi:cystathionine beta-synthase
MANPEAHYLTTGPEIWEDTDGQIDALVGGIGTGGTMSGAAKYIKERAAAAGRTVRVVCPDPRGSIYHDLYYKGVEPKPSVYRVEGIGHDFMVGTLDFSVIDEVLEVSDRDSFRTTRRLAREEGIFSGGSTGTALWGALKVARELGPGKIVVVIIPDSGDRYLSKLYSDAWMEDMGFVGPSDRLGTVRDILKSKGGKVEFAAAEETIGHVASRMSELGFSQMPLQGADDGAALRMVHELDILQGLVSARCTANDPVMDVAKVLQGQVALDDPLTAVQSVFDAHNVAVVVEGGKVVGIISKIDVVQFLAARRK